MKQLKYPNRGKIDSLNFRLAEQDRKLADEDSEIRRHY